MAVEMNENVCYNVPGTILKGVKNEIKVNESSNKKNLSKEISSPYLKSKQDTSNSSVTFVVKNCLAITFSMILLLQVILSSVIVVLYLKVSTLEANEPTVATTQINKTLLNYLLSHQLEFRELLQQNNASKYTTKQNFSFLDNQCYHKIASLNSSVQLAVNYLKRVALPILSYNQTCAEIAKSSNDYSSGDYILKLSAEAIRTVYCDMTNTLGGSTSGWMRIAKLDVDNCPKGLNTTIRNSVNTCIRSESSAGCTEIHYSTHNVRYSNISGAVRALAIGYLDGFNNADGNTSRSNNVNLNSNYLDGVSVSSNNEHVWSFAAGCYCDEVIRNVNNNNPNKPIFVGNDFTCSTFEYLWRSQQCGSDSSWFFKMLPPTTADITVRVCRDQASSEEDIALTELELYIQ